jgi:hypothetical protein
MNSMGRYVLRLVVFGAIAIANPRLALATDAENGPAFKLAMGPTSAAQKNQGLSTTSDNTTADCVPSEGACPKPHHHSKSKRAGSAAPSR